MSAETRAAPAASASWVWRLAAGVLVSAAVLGLFLLFGAVGARAAAHDARVLAGLDPLIEWIRGAGKVSADWILAHCVAVAGVTTAIVAAVVLIGVRHRRAAPVIVLGAAVCLATWGQVVLLLDQVTAGICLYGCGFACAVALGVWCPMTRLAGFPPMPGPARGEPPPSSNRPTAVSGRALLLECALVVLLSLAGLLVRLYALTELPYQVDLEMVESIVSSRSGYGLLRYIQYGFLANSTGLIHLLPKPILFGLFGTSLYTLRLSSVLFGVAAIPLLYWLARRLAGMWPAAAATVLFVTAPEQLYWSRSENSNFAPIAVLALISAHLGLWLVERLSIGALFAAALWMPVTRYFYQAGLTMAFYPVVLAGHALIAVRGWWRKAGFVVPLLAGGLILWVLSVSILLLPANDWHWQFVPPVGAGLLTRNGELLDIGWFENIRSQAVSMIRNLGVILEAMTYHVSGFSHWYARADASAAHMTTINVGLAVAVALGLGYLLGQLSDRRAFALVAWVGLGLLPGIMSNDPADRRIATVYPAFDIIAAIMLAAAVRLVRERTARARELRLVHITRVGMAVFVAGVAWTNLVSHFRLPISHPSIEGPIRFAEPMFHADEVILHNLEPGLMLGLVFGNLDRFRQATPGIEPIDTKALLYMALNPRCSFSGALYDASLPPDRIGAVRAAFKPQRLTFLFRESSYTHPFVDLLRELYPRATLRTYQGADGIFAFVALTVSMDDVEALHTPSLHLPPRTALPEAGVLAGVVLAPQATDHAVSTEAVTVDGGVLVKREGWYRIGTDPPCPASTVTIDGAPAPSTTRPMLAGIHPFRITLPSPTRCRLPLRLLMQSFEAQDMAPISPDVIVGPAAAAVRGAQAPPVVAYAGYGEARPFVQTEGRPVDFAVDAAGHVNVLLQDRGTLWVKRFDPDGHLEATWQPEIAAGQDLTSVAVDPTGAIVVMGAQALTFYDQAGHRVGAWKEPAMWANEATFWRDRFLRPMPDRNAITMLGHDEGEFRGDWQRFEGGPGVFQRPISVTVSSQGDILVIQEDAQALLFHNRGDEWNPTFVATFRIGLTSPPSGRRCAFDGSERILIADPPTNTPLVYDFTGKRRMAAAPERDLSAKGFVNVTFSRIEATQQGLYLLDSSARLWKLAR